MGVLSQLLSGENLLTLFHPGASRAWRSHPASQGSGERVHVSAVCYRLRRGEPEFLLVRTRNGHWTFPKGGVDEDATHADAAAREAYEEAGVKGRVERLPFVSYRHRKHGSRREHQNAISVHAHLCHVKRLVKPKEGYRNPTWFSTTQAKRRLRKYRSSEFAAEITRVIDRAAERLRHR